MTPSTLPILELACAEAGVDTEGAEVIRVSENVLWRLPGNIVARVGRQGTGRSAEREIAIARWLQSEDFPAVRPAEKLDQVRIVDGHPVTFWQELPPHRRGRMRELGALLRRLHGLPTPDQFDPGELSPLVRIRERIESATTLDAADQSWLTEHAQILADRWEQLPTGRPRCVVHGDAWEGNVAVTAEGPILLDFERCSVGPPEWDLVQSAIKESSFGWSPGEYSEFAAAYGYDVISYPGFSTIRDIRELRMTTFTLQLAADDPSHVVQAQHRVDCLRGRCGSRPWNGWRPTP